MSIISLKLKPSENVLKRACVSSLILNGLQRVTEGDKQIKLDLWLPFCVKYLPTAAGQPHLFVIPPLPSFPLEDTGSILPPICPQKIQLEGLITHTLADTDMCILSEISTKPECRINVTCGAFIHPSVWSVVFAFGYVFVTSWAIMTSLWSYLWPRGFVCDEL